MSSLVCSETFGQRVTVYSLKVTALHVTAFDLGAGSLGGCIQGLLTVWLETQDPQCLWISFSVIEMWHFQTKRRAKGGIMITTKRIHFFMFKRGSIYWWPRCGVSDLRSRTEWQAVLILRALFFLSFAFTVIFLRSIHKLPCHRSSSLLRHAPLYEPNITIFYPWALSIFCVCFYEECFYLAHEDKHFHSIYLELLTEGHANVQLYMIMPHCFPTILRQKIYTIWRKSRVCFPTILTPTSRILPIETPSTTV